MNAPGTIYDVLVVDDSPVYRKLVEQVLESQPFRLHFAQNGEEALRLIEEFSPAIVVTDWMMPDFSGPALCQRIRKDQSRPYICVVMMKRNTDKRNAGQGRHATP